MANDRPRRDDADAALEEILREVERSPRRRSFLDDDDEQPRRSAEPETRRSRSEEPQRRQRVSTSDAESRAAQSAANREAQERRSMQNRPILAGSAPRRQQPQERSASQQRPARPDSRQPQRQPQQAEERPRRQSAPRPANEQQQRRPRPQNGRPGARTVRRRASKWRIGMLLYIALFFVITLFLMHRLWVYLGEYELSRPQYTIDGYVTHLSSGFYSDMIRKKVEQLPFSEYESADTIADTLIAEAPEETNYTWSKNPKDYTDEQPVYYVRCGNAAIASVSLERISGTEKFNFPIWRANDPVSLIEVAETPAYDVDITIPSGASVMINGQAVSLTKMEETDSAIELDDTALDYTEQPKAQHTTVSGLYVAPEVKAFDATGNELEALKKPDSSDPHQVYVFVPKDEVSPDPALEARMEDLSKAYINYMINQNLTQWDNLAAVEQYLITGSKAQTTLRSIVGDVAWNNPYTERKDKVLDISHFKMYSDTVCTVETHFELQLTMNVVNDYVGTVRWTMVKVGDTWKGVAFEVLQSADPAAETPAEQSAEHPAETPAEPSAEPAAEPAAEPEA